MSGPIKHTILCCTTVCILAGLSNLTGCTSLTEDRINKDGYEEAATALERIKINGSLPGFASQEHGRIWFVLPVWGHNKNQVTFPKMLTLYASKNEEKDVEYEYVVLKKAPGLEWLLIKAWKKSKDQKELIFSVE